MAGLLNIFIEINQPVIKTGIAHFIGPLGSKNKVRATAIKIIAATFTPTLITGSLFPDFAKVLSAINPAIAGVETIIKPDQIENSKANSCNPKVSKILG